jgi:ribonuclease P/MRP protein subunit POP8
MSQPCMNIRFGALNSKISASSGKADAKFTSEPCIHSTSSQPERETTVEMASVAAPNLDSSMNHDTEREDISMTGVEDAKGRNELPTASKKGSDITTKTIKNPSFSYAYLEYISDGQPTSDLDILTVRSHLTSGLNQFLGLTGSAISVDILKVDQKGCWIRVPREDLRAVIAAMGQWVGAGEGNAKVAWKLKASGNWLGSLVASQGIQDTWAT